MEKRILKITDIVYKQYGSGTGYLFGIPPNLRSAVEAVVKATMAIAEDKETMSFVEEEED